VTLRETLRNVVFIRCRAPWTYTLNNFDPDTIALQGGDNVQDDFTYTVEDSGGLIDTATLTINVQGSYDLMI